ncbi:Wadjet anti-phage system protein JetD domain-containing protein [Tindallia californiensis]|uniref:Wadjet protein JetD C-terminal domain-containing protein n=1 Tax=Tindallia californiensis TaxID=159292 RepID=A0A1H3QQ93_9FIRM|nr:Wadjet anti-phage system protein JetD domain-containing protein [Tindallia californiensis]SDZ15453.1 hypothetical protein SAMN05192546_11046 [Tindallia californiensis]
MKSDMKANDLKKTIIKELQQHPYKTIMLMKLEEWCPSDSAYADFSAVVMDLMEEEVLTRIKSAGENRKSPSLPYKFRIEKHGLKREQQQELRRQAANFHPAMDLSAYYRKELTAWKRDLPALKKVNDYLQKHGTDFTGHTLPELSWKLTGNEKWLEEQGGKQLLERINLWHQVEKQMHPDPLMLALNPSFLSEVQAGGNKTLPHLIVENKSMYYRLLPLLSSSNVATLVYGAGRKIVAGLSQLPYQLGLEKAGNLQHTIHYFGDLDWEGIAIWNDLQKRYTHVESWDVIPATAFYQSLAQCSWSQGKTNQRQQEEALKEFLDYFSSEEGKNLRRQLEAGFYCPQEALEEGLESLMKKG